MKKWLVLTLSSFLLFADELPSPILKMPEPYSDTLVVAFGGVNMRMGFPPFEFFNMLKPYHVQKMFVRDVQKAWYQNGLNPGQTIDTAVDILREAIESFHAKHIIFVGNSSGGYAALLFGLLLEVDQVHAFVPYTNLNWSHLENKDAFDQKYFLLKPIFEDYPNCKTHFHIYYNPKSRRDAIQASALQPSRTIHHHEHSEGGHGLIKILKRSGELKLILERAIAAGIES